jgi:hypothetical protein
VAWYVCAIMHEVERVSIAGAVFKAAVLLAVAAASDWAARSQLRVWVAHYWDEALVVVSWVVVGILWLRVREMRKEREEFFRRFADAMSEAGAGEGGAPHPGDEGKG